jgi:hypothetical protein
MRKQWWCANCLIQIELDIHGRCKICGSNAVDRMQRNPEQMKPEEVKLDAVVYSQPPQGERQPLLVGPS